ncbi:NACHT domain-containing protein [Actinokineospora cianjurensis]|uniref:NACHT domain-containing protein n=1 Tax=Actinokineospora cianjurensis TaxID=585224 RepID=A0A421B1A7_9PSEU|nr:hypothetical protein [Actinokineospora cianjurensis]RLK58132.1 hypothetical protein CLV68_4226 [Actinokineospora cianjurensis]
MVEQHNRITQSTITGPVLQARDIGTVVIGDARPAHPPLTSWADLPAVDEDLHDLLDVQQDAFDTLPYRLLDITPPELSQIYVQQRIRANAPGQDPDDAPIAERVLSATEALDTESHVVITGEPGAGKSTLGQMYVQRICAYWLGKVRMAPPLREPVLPVRIPARALAADSSWSELVAAGVRQVLGGMLATPPDPALFARRTLGARWLVFVDGLDEIIDTGTRERVIRTIVARMRRGTDHRIVVTTRPLPRSEMAMFDRVGAQIYAIQPFGVLELEEFARAWFRAQDSITAQDRATDFIRQVRDGRLREIVRNPLLATIAAITFTLSPDRELPRSMTSLYARFMDHLLTDNANGRRTVAELAASREPRRAELVRWVDERRVELIEHLARHVLESEGSLAESARKWVTDHHDGEPAGWAEDLLTVLTSSGILVRIEGDLRFLHHSFAEFLAARSHAQEIDPEFTELDRWISRATWEAQRGFAIFTFLLWGRENKIDRVIERLLDGDANSVAVAGRLLTGDIPVAEEVAAPVLNRLVDLLIGAGLDRAPASECREIGRVLAGIGMHEWIAEGRLRLLRDDARIAMPIRVESAIVLGRLGWAGAVGWLEDLAAEVEPQHVEHIVLGLIDLVPDGRDRAERLLLAAGYGAEYALTLTVATMLLTIERGPAAADLVRDLVRRMRTDTSLGHRMPVQAVTTTAPLRTMDSWFDHRPNWDDLVRVARGSHCPAEARWAAEHALACSDDHDAVAEAIKVLVEHDVESAFAAAATRKPSIVAEVMDHFTSPHREQLAQRCLRETTETSDSRIRVQAAKVLSAAGIELEAVSGLSHASILDLAASLAGQPTATMRALAEAAMADATCTWYTFRRAASILAPLPDGARLVVEQAKRHGPKHQLQAIIALAQAEREAEVHDVVDLLIEEPTSVQYVWETVITLHAKRWREVRDRLVDSAIRSERSWETHDMANMAHALHLVGRRAEAIDQAWRALRRSLVSSPTSDYWMKQPVSVLIEVAGTGCAVAVTAELIRADVTVSHRMVVADWFTEQGLLPSAVELWEDVVAHHGHYVEQGVAAARKLVATGHADVAARAVAAALAEAGRSKAAVAGLRALEAWIGAW